VKPLRALGCCFVERSLYNDDDEFDAPSTADLANASTTSPRRTVSIFETVTGAVRKIWESYP
jgi:hypothetical protein